MGAPPPRGPVLAHHSCGGAFNAKAGSVGMYCGIFLYKPPVLAYIRRGEGLPPYKHTHTPHYLGVTSQTHTHTTPLSLSTLL